LRKLILKNRLSPGDIITLTGAVRDLHMSYPGEFLTDVRTSCMDFWAQNPYVTPLDEDDPEVEIIDCEYPLIHESNQLPVHFIHGFRIFLSEKLNLPIRPYAFRGDIHLGDEEKSWLSQVSELVCMPDVPYWIIDAGGKTDFTAKWWDHARYQEVVDHFRGRVLFVQCGAADSRHYHPHLRGVIDLVGRTDLRQLVRLMYHADGVVCPVTMFMHLAAAVEPKPGRPLNRACVVIAGGREPAQWEAYPNHQFLHRCGCLPCCEEGGCWRSRVLPLDDGLANMDDRLCLFPTVTSSGAVIPRCLDMVTTDDVVRAIELYLGYSSFAFRTLPND
jgi:hypothetical protein